MLYGRCSTGANTFRISLSRFRNTDFSCSLTILCVLFFFSLICVFSTKNISSYALNAHSVSISISVCPIHSGYTQFSVESIGLISLTIFALLSRVFSNSFSTKSHGDNICYTFIYIWKKCKHTFNVRLMKRTRISTEKKAKQPLIANSNQAKQLSIGIWHVYEYCICVVEIRSNRCDVIVTLPYNHKSYTINLWLMIPSWLFHFACVLGIYIFSIRFHFLSVLFFFRSFVRLVLRHTILPSFYWILLFFCIFIQHRYLGVQLIQVMFPPYFRGHINTYNQTYHQNLTMYACWIHSKFHARLLSSMKFSRF